MKCGVLGPLEVFDDGVAITPTAPKLQSILAVLLTSPSSTVSREALIDEIWPNHPPATATVTMNTYVYTLRRLLAAGPSGRTDVIRSKPSGYELALSPQCLDLTAFDAGVALGRQALAAGHLVEASALLRDALRLRRGPMLAGLSKGPVLTSIAARVEEDVLDATALRIETDLHLGRHRELIGELRGLVSLHPTNEDFHAKLILALYRSERRSIALEAYHTLRQTLLDNVGVDPSPGLQRLHEEVLVDAPTLMWTTELAAAA